MNVRDICSSYDWIESYSIDGALQTVLSHNDEPTSLQAMSVATSKEHIDLAHEHIIQDIATLENALELLRSRRDALHRLSIQHAGALSAFRRLPNEILLEIFLRACGEERFRVACLHEGPWKFRAVCQKWASIVEGCSQLWCNMFIDVSHHVDPAAFAQALQFCGSRPIHMELSTNERYRRVPRKLRNFHGVLDAIIFSSSRWETLSIESVGGLFRFVMTLFPRLEQNLPLLRSLTLRGAEHENIQSMSSPVLQTLLAAPLLESLRFEFNSERNGQLLDILPIPCQQIRQLSFNFVDYEPASRHGPLSLSKEKFPHLEHCVFLSYDASTQLSGQVSATDRLKHDGVVQLVTSRADVLNAFSFPSLHTLSIGEPDQVPQIPLFEWDSSAVVFKTASDMLLASRCSLVSLVLSYSFTLVDEFRQILDIVPTLEMLHMRIVWCEGAVRDKVLCKFFTALGNRTSTSTFSLLPALQDLRLSIAAPPYWLFNDEYFDPFNPEPRDFHFVSWVFQAIAERSKCPSDFRMFSFKMLASNTACWRLSKGEIDQLRGLELTKFRLEAWSDYTDYEEEESSA